MFSFLKKDRQVLDEASVQWLFDSYAFFLQQFDADFFHNQTTLITPSNEHFPGREQSIEGMASLIFDAVKGYAGMSHWPCRLIDQQQFDPDQQVQAVIEGPLRLPTTDQTRVADPSSSLLIPYDPSMVGTPEALIASYAHLLSYHLLLQNGEIPPGGEENLPHASEALAVFMGFGLMFANTAYTFKQGGCSSCGIAGRFNYLSQYDVTYALAIFSHLKSVPTKQVLRYLKKPLAAFYKQALQDVTRRGDALTRLTR